VIPLISSSYLNNVTKKEIAGNYLSLFKGTVIPTKQEVKYLGLILDTRHSASKTNINEIQILQNRILRIVTDAPRYVRNDTLHTDLHVPIVSDTLQKTYSTPFDTFQLHTSQLITTILNTLTTTTTREKAQKKNTIQI
jgi:hypothetical protein